MTTWKQQLKHALVPLAGLNAGTATLSFVEQIRDVANARIEQVVETAVIPCKVKAIDTARHKALYEEADLAIVVAATRLKEALNRPFVAATGGLMPGVDKITVATQSYRLDKVIATGWLDDEPSSYTLILKQETP